MPACSEYRFAFEIQLFPVCFLEYSKALEAPDIVEAGGALW
jgi:hypothetical protein